MGTIGTSWSGWTQTALAALGPEGLATMVANMSGADAHEPSVRHGGALELRFLAWAFWHWAYNTQAALTAQPHVQAALNQGLERSTIFWSVRLRAGSLMKKFGTGSAPASG